MKEQKVIADDRKVENIRIGILDLCYKLGTNAAHLGGCLSLADIIDVLYTEVLTYDTTDLMSEKRDRVVMSKGHGSIAMYVGMYKAGIIHDLNCCGNLMGENNIFYKQEVRNPQNGIEFSSGSLGQGLAYGIGIAWALKRRGNTDSKVYIFIGDGECNEGSVWESASIASQLNLDNIVVIIDKNNLQIDGYTKDINSQELMTRRWKSFGFESIEINGHDKEEIRGGLRKNKGGKPLAIIANTVKGKGIPFIENDAKWHQNVVTDTIYQEALLALKENI